MNNRNQKDYVRIKKPIKHKRKPANNKFVKWQESSICEDSVEASSIHADNEQEEEESLASPTLNPKYQKIISDEEIESKLV